MRQILTLFFFVFIVSCERNDKINSNISKEALVENYCSLGASTASMGWQKKVASVVATNYLSFAVGGSRWAHNNESNYDLSANGSGNANNLVMTNQLARLLKYKSEKNYQPDIITLFCGLNDAANGSGIIGNFADAISYDLDVTPEQWFYNDKYKTVRNTVYGSVTYVINSLVYNFPDSKIVIFTNQQCNNGTYNNTNVSLVNDVLKNIADHYNLKIVDIYNESGIIIKDNEPSPYLGSDQLHPNALGEALLYTFVSSKLEAILKII